MYSIKKLKWPFLFEELGKRRGNADREVVMLTASAAPIRSPSKQRELSISRIQMAIDIQGGMEKVDGSCVRISTGSNKSKRGSQPPISPLAFRSGLYGCCRIPSARPLYS